MRRKACSARLKPIEQLDRRDRQSKALRKTLSWPHLVALGVGAIVGTGIYTLTGVGADRAGPAVILAFAIAGVVCACAALAYAELATMIPTAGSAYTYTYSVHRRDASPGSSGWSLILEYSLACSTVAVGWSGLSRRLAPVRGHRTARGLAERPHAGGIINLPAVLVALAVAGMLIAGTRESATLNIVLVIIKMTALAAFVVLAAPAFDADNLTPFSPYGFGSHVDAEGVHARRHGRGGDRLFRVLWIRRGGDIRRGGEESVARSHHRHHRFDGGVHSHLHAGRGRPRSAR